jgi:hypothetical protein
MPRVESPHILGVIILILPHRVILFFGGEQADWVGRHLQRVKSIEGCQHVHGCGLYSVIGPETERLRVQRTPSWLQGMRLQSHPHPTVRYLVLLEQLYRVLGRCGVTRSLQYLPQDEGKSLSCETVCMGNAFPPSVGTWEVICASVSVREKEREPKIEGASAKD